MAEREDVTGLTEDALFDQAIDPPVSEPTPSPPPEPEPKEPKPAPQSEPKPDGKPEQLDTSPKEDDAPMVPSWRLKEITEERRAAQAERDAIRQERDRLVYEQQEFRRRLAQLEKPVEPPPEPDPLLDPRGYREFMERRLDERLANERRENYLQLAHRTYGEEFDQAYAAAKKLITPALRERMQNAADPGEELIGWFRDLKWKHEVGNDLGAYKKRIIDEDRKAREADPEYRKAALQNWRNEAQSSQQSNGRPMLAPSLNGVSRSSAALRASQQDLSDDDLWSSTTN